MRYLHSHWPVRCSFKLSRFIDQIFGLFCVLHIHNTHKGSDFSAQTSPVRSLLQDLTIKQLNSDFHSLINQIMHFFCDGPEKFNAFASLLVQPQLDIRTKMCDDYVSQLYLKFKQVQSNAMILRADRPQLTTMKLLEVAVAKIEAHFPAIIAQLNPDAVYTPEKNVSRVVAWCSEKNRTISVSPVISSVLNNTKQTEQTEQHKVPDGTPSSLVVQDPSSNITRTNSVEQFKQLGIEEKYIDPNSDDLPPVMSAAVTLTRSRSGNFSALDRVNSKISEFEEIESSFLSKKQSRQSFMDTDPDLQRVASRIQKNMRIEYVYCGETDCEVVFIPTAAKNFDRMVKG